MRNPIYDEKDIVVIDLISQTQGEIYDLAFKKGLDIEDFSNKYLSSDFCNIEMDAVYSKYQTDFADSCFVELEKEFAEKNIILKHKSKDLYVSPYYVGYIYRMLFFELQIKSSELIIKFPFDKICSFYSESLDQSYEYVVDCLIQDDTQ